MKSIKKIVVFYTDGTFEEMEKPQTIDLGKITTPSYTISHNMNSYSGSQESNKPMTYSLNPSPIGTLTTASIQALTTSQIQSLYNSDYVHNLS
jgi:hypothetical protein